MLPIAATALSAAQFAYMFENSAHFLMTIIGNSKWAHPTISLRLSLEMPSTKRTLAKGPARKNVLTSFKSVVA